MGNKFTVDKSHFDSDFHCRWQNFPNVQYYKGAAIHYIVGAGCGFYDDKRCIMQVIRNEKVCTVAMNNNKNPITDEAYGDYYLTTSSLDGFYKFFNKNTPLKIRERYPLLNDLLDKGRAFDSSFDSSFHFYSFYWGRKMSIFIIEMGPPFVGDELSESQLNILLSSVDCVLAIEQEYELFKKTVYFKSLEESFKKQEPDPDDNYLAMTVALAQAISLVCELFNIENSNGSDFHEYVSWDNMCLAMRMLLSQLDANPVLIDYLTSSAGTSDSTCPDRGDDKGF